MKDKCFGRRVNRKIRKRLKPGGGGNIQDPAFFPIKHSRKEEARQMRDGLDIEIQHGFCIGKSNLSKGPVMRQARIVDEDIHVYFF